MLESRVGERSRQESVTPEAFAELEKAMKGGEIAMASSTLTPTAWGNLGYLAKMRKSNSEFPNSST